MSFCRIICECFVSVISNFGLYAIIEYSPSKKWHHHCILIHLWIFRPGSHEWMYNLNTKWKLNVDPATTKFNIALLAFCYFQNISVRTMQDRFFSFRNYEMIRTIIIYNYQHADVNKYGALYSSINRLFRVVELNWAVCNTKKDWNSNATIFLATSFLTLQKVIRELNAIGKRHVLQTFALRPAPLNWICHKFRVWIEKSRPSRYFSALDILYKESHIRFSLVTSPSFLLMYRCAL